MGADAVLLIVAALDDDELRRACTTLAIELGLDVLVEVHDEAGAGSGPRRRGHRHRREPARPRHLRGRHRARGARGCRHAGRRSSGWPSPGSAVPMTRPRLAAAGFHAVLVGESVVTAGRPGCIGRRSAPRALGSVHRVFVKICGITSEEDALLAVAMGADAVGFNFVPSSPRFLAASRAADIAKRLPPEILTVGVFRDEAPARVVELVEPGRVCGRPSSTATSRPRTPAGSASASPSSSRPSRVVTPSWPRQPPTAPTSSCSTRPAPAPARCSTGRWPRARRRDCASCWPAASRPRTSAEAIDRVPPVGRRRGLGRRVRPWRQGPHQGPPVHQAAQAAEPDDYHGGEDDRPSTGCSTYGDLLVGLIRLARPLARSADPLGRDRRRRPAARDGRSLGRRAATGSSGGGTSPRRSWWRAPSSTSPSGEAWVDAAFRAELDRLLRDYAGRPSLLYEARRLSAELGCTLLLKREDLNHTGSHKINNVLGQALLAQRMGKHRIIAETGAGQHGVASRHRRRAPRPRVRGVHGRGRHAAPGAQRLPHAAPRRRGAPGHRPAAAR